MNNLKIFACNSAEDFAEKVCKEIGCSLGQKESFKFKNDNTFVKILETVRDSNNTTACKWKNYGIINNYRCS